MPKYYVYDLEGKKLIGSKLVDSKDTINVDRLLDKLSDFISKRKNYSITQEKIVFDKDLQNCDLEYYRGNKKNYVLRMKYAMYKIDERNNFYDR